MNKFFQICIFCIVFLAIGIAFTNIADLQNQNTNLNNQLTQQEQTYSGKIDELTVYQEKLVERISLLEENYQKLKTAYDELKAAYDQYILDSTFEREQIQVTVVDLRETIAVLEQNADVDSQTITALRAEVTALETSLENQTTTANELQATVTQQEVTIAELNTTIDTLIAELNADLATIDVYQKIFEVDGKLVSLTAKDFGEITAIRPYAFYYCSNLYEVELPGTCKSIGERAFSQCTNLASFKANYGLTEIGSYAFNPCANLCSVSVPDSIVRVVGTDCFGGCPNLEFFVENNIKYLGNSTNPYVILYSVNSRGYTELSLPNGVRYIGINAFYSCSQLTTVIMPDSVVYIDNSCFNRCSNLISVKLSNNLNTIGYGAFANCSKLVNISIPKTVKKFDSSAFNNCTSLTNIVIPSNVTYMGSQLFSGCTSLATVYIDSTDALLLAIGNYSDSYLFNYTEYVYIQKDINVSGYLFNLLSDTVYTLDEIDYLKYSESY